MIFPFKHQAQVFRLVGEEDKEAYLVAGTASGKTLAIAVPLFHKLQTKQIRRVLLMYPTIALMEDQRRVMDKLAEITHVDVGMIQGGMTRSELISALNKQVILATPDAVYWFFQKNVKYSGLLIYGLALVDEFVLDEAHLFNGLMLRNLRWLKERIHLLSQKLGKQPRWHILTATPTDALRDFSKGAFVSGKSKVGAVQVEFVEPTPVTKAKERAAKFADLIQYALDEGGQKVLVVLNSAAAAHRLFEQLRGGSPLLPIELHKKFGAISWKHLREWLAQEQIPTEIRAQIEKFLRGEERFYLRDLESGAVARVRVERLVHRVSDFFAMHLQTLKSTAYAAQREKNNNLIESIRARVAQRKSPKLIWEILLPSSRNAATAEEIKFALDNWANELMGRVENSWNEDGEGKIGVTAWRFPEIMAGLNTLGLPNDLVEQIFKYLVQTVLLEAEDARALRITDKELGKRMVRLAWLESPWLIEDETMRQKLLAKLDVALAHGSLKAETKQIALWGNTDVPAVIYTGKLSKAARKGLIDAFSQMPRAILISTSAVEVGVDFAADFLITEECDGNAFLQRFGRVGRREDIQARVRVLLREGQTYIALQQRAKEKMTREEFSTLIADPEVGVFPKPIFVERSDFLDASHFLVNEQLGVIGSELNVQMFSDQAIREFAAQLRASDVSFAYGLRGTMPGVELVDGSSGDVFYVLTRVVNDELLPSESPFEMAHADLSYMEFLYRKGEWNIRVDWQNTLKASRALFYRLDGKWRVQVGYGLASEYFETLNIPQRTDYIRSLFDEFQQDHAQVIEFLEVCKQTSRAAAALLPLGDLLWLMQKPFAHLILGQGDVHLERVHKEKGIKMPIEDRLGNPLVLSNQVWLLSDDQNKDGVKENLKNQHLWDLEEILYDENGEMVWLLDRVGGACFFVYERLARDVGE